MNKGLIKPLAEAFLQLISTTDPDRPAIARIETDGRYKAENLFSGTCNTTVWV